VEWTAWGTMTVDLLALAAWLSEAGLTPVGRARAGGVGAGRAIRAVLIEGCPDPATLAAVAQGRRRRQIPRLELALTGLVRTPHRSRPAIPWAPLVALDAQRETLGGRSRGA
jgi:hypothetical protein